MATSRLERQVTHPERIRPTFAAERSWRRPNGAANEPALHTHRTAFSGFNAGAPTRIAIGAAIFSQILAVAPASLAQPFEIIQLGEDGRGFEAGEVEFEANSAYQTGFPDDAEEATRFGSELSVGLALTDFLKLEGGLVLTQDTGDDLDLSNVAFEATLAPDQLRGDNFAAGLFLAIEPRIGEHATNEFVFGPVFQFEAGQTIDVVLNPFFEQTFGRNSEDGLAFAYGWQAAAELTDGLAIGLEGYGEIEDVFGNPPGSDDQEHRIGPVVSIDNDLFGGGPKFEVSFGVLGGLTRGTPDAAFRLNIEVELGTITEH